MRVSSDPRAAVRRLMRAGLAATGGLAALMAAVLVLPGQALPGGWPWSGGPLAEMFVASVLAAIAAPMLWVAWHGHLAGTAAGFVHMATMAGGIALVLGVDGDRATATAAAALTALGSLAAWAWVRHEPPADPRPLPPVLRAWCVVFVAVLLTSGISMLRGVPGVMPWPITDQASQLYGWVFASAACSFAYPALAPRLEHVKVGLIGFVAYNIVLIPPLALHLGAVSAEMRPSLVRYLVVLLVTFVPSVWYLAFSPATRARAATAPGPATTAADPVARRAA